MCLVTSGSSLQSNFSNCHLFFVFGGRRLHSLAKNTFLRTQQQKLLFEARKQINLQRIGTFGGLCEWREHSSTVKERFQHSPKLSKVPVLRGSVGLGIFSNKNADLSPMPALDVFGDIRVCSAGSLPSILPNWHRFLFFWREGVSS